MTERNDIQTINRMAAASQCAGIMAAGSAVILFLSGMGTALLSGMVCGCLGILFAHLSKGASLRFSGQAMTGLGMSIFGVSICLLMMLLSLVVMLLSIQMFGLETVLDPEALTEAMEGLMSRYLETLGTGGGAL